ncbi:dihydrofolate reductase family protein [Nonomuraea sp. B5E05]|uniref:dihydrofolate reductase family protein n=1 Tax=Nonomuraea sp. B5E05 TaxID=3153569 RepID=UPI00326149A4
MAKIISSFFISVDGVVESPDQWHFPYWNDEMGAVVEAGMQTAAMLMGRKLYDEWSTYWTTTDADPEVAASMNTARKFVVSSTLEKADWDNTTIVSGDVAARLREIKQEISGGDIGMSGSATTVRWLLANGLLDELHLLVHPIAVGHGQRLFEDTPTHPLKLVKSETFQTGVLNLTYVPDAG